jgi:hypothetical protein
MKFVIQNQTHWLASVPAGSYVVEQNDRGAFSLYTSSMRRAFVYDTAEDAVAAVERRNSVFGGIHPATFALVPVEVPTPTVRRLI